MSRHHKNSRQGVSLTELLVLMSSYTLILSLSGMLLGRVMRIEVDSRSFMDAERSCSRLDHQFRNDLHEALSFDIRNATPGEGEFLILQLPENRTVAYSRSNGNIRRLISRKDKLLSRDEFAFQPSCSVEIRQEESPKRVILAVTSPAPDVTNAQAKQLQNLKAVPVGLSIEACAGRNGRLTNLSSQRESPK
jgi:hypothetical protein